MHSKDKRIETTETILVYENQYAKIYDNKVTFPQNKDGHYLKFDWTAPYGVAVLPVLAGGSIYLARNFRYASDGFSIEIPKGFGVEGILPSEMARRELIEETGLYSEDIKEIASVRTDPGLINHAVHIFCAEGCLNRTEPTPEFSEVFEQPLIVNIDEVWTLIKDGIISDSLTISAIAIYCRSLKL
jgi:8-oxo-dGTP pyrophosphatase MutT (NUDIX family)